MIHPLCNSKKAGEFNLLVCVRELGHAGDHTYVPVPSDQRAFILKRDEDIAKACAILKELSQPGKTLDEMLAPFSPQVELKQS